MEKAKTLFANLTYGVSDPVVLSQTLSLSRSNMPMVNEHVYGRFTSIEHYYPKKNLLREDEHGRRLFLGEEFYESGISKCKTYITKSKGIQNKVKVNGVIDEKVYRLIDDPEQILFGIVMLN